MQEEDHRVARDSCRGWVAAWCSVLEAWSLVGLPAFPSVSRLCGCAYGVARTLLGFTAKQSTESYMFVQVSVCLIVPSVALARLSQVRRFFF